MLDSICELSLRSRKFASIATGQLVDMFNDEIDTVRVCAINSLYKIGKIIFDEDQLHIVLKTMEDTDIAARKAIYKLLQVSNIDDTSNVQMVLMSLLTNMERFPEDIKNVYECCKKIGANHPYLIGMSNLLYLS